MKRQTIKSLVASLAITVCGIPTSGIAGSSSPPRGVDCHAISSGLRKAVASNPSQVLVLVEDSMIANGFCACEIVKAGILGAGANAGTAEANRLVEQIVYAAITVNPSMSSIIVECAMAVAPGASAEIQAALSKALGGAKGGGVLREAAPDFGSSPGLSGIYLIPPVASGAVLIREVFEKCEEKIVVERKTSTVIIEREVIPVSPSSAH